MEVMINRLKNVSYKDVAEDRSDHEAVQSWIGTGDKDVKVIRDKGDPGWKDEGFVQKRGLLPMLFGEKSPEEITDRQETADQGYPDENLAAGIAALIDAEEHQDAEDAEDKADEEEFAAIEKNRFLRFVHLGFILFCLHSIEFRRSRALSQRERAFLV